MFTFTDASCGSKWQEVLFKWPRNYEIPERIEWMVISLFKGLERVRGNCPGWIDINTRVL